MATKTKAPTASATNRALLVLVSELATLTESTKLVQAQVIALAARHGITIPDVAEIT